MPDTEATTKASHEIAGDGVIEIPRKELPENEAQPMAEGVSLTTTKRPRAGLLQGLNKLKPLLPLVSSGLRLVDHGLAQAVAQLLYLAGGPGNAQTAAEEELQHGLAEIQSGHRDLHHQVQDQTVELQRIQDQITLLRETLESTAAKQAELAARVGSINNLAWIFGTGLAVLLIVLIALIALLLTRHS